MGLTAENIIEYILNAISILATKEVIIPTIIVLGGVKIYRKSRRKGS